MIQNLKSRSFVGRRPVKCWREAVNRKCTLGSAADTTLNDPGRLKTTLGFFTI